jgi:cell division protein FtsB
MREFKKRRTLRAEILRVGSGLLGVAALALVAFGASRAALAMYGKFTEAAAARAGAETQLSELQTREQVIKTDVAALSSDRGVEAAMRERYGVAKPGEGQINIVRQATTSEALHQGPGFWQKVWQTLFVW